MLEEAELVVVAAAAQDEAASPTTTRSSMAVPPRPRRIRALHLATLALGAIAFAVLVRQLGWQTFERAVVGAGWWFAVLAAVDLGTVFCDAAGVHAFARAHGPVSYWRVFAAQASGMAINRLTPGNSLGEPIKVTMLLPHVARDTAVAAIVKFNLATLYVAIAVIVLGVPLTLLSLELSARVELAVWLGTIVLLLLAFALALVVRRGALATILEAARGVRLISAPRATRWIAKSRAIDADIRSFGDPAARRALAFVAASRAVHFVGTIAVLEAAGIPFTMPIVIGMLSVGILVTWAASIVPLGLGVADGTNYLLYGALGSVPALGLDFTMVTRTRTLVLAAMGLAIMVVANLVGRRPTPGATVTGPAGDLSGVRRQPDAPSEVRT